MNGQGRLPAGTPVGGQFSATSRTEPDVVLTGSIPRSSDRKDSDTYQWPGNVDRYDALTAYDDIAGIYTIGDDLTVRLERPDPRWIARARGPLAVLHRAGVAGDGYVVQSLTPEFRRWVAKVPMPSGRLIELEDTADAPGFTIRSGDSGTWVAHPEHRAGPYDQDRVDHQVERVVREGAFLDQWKRNLRVLHGGATSWGNGALIASRRSDTDPTWLLIRPRVGQVDTFVAVRDGQVVEIKEAGPPNKVTTNPDLVWANLARRLGVAGGRAAGAPGKVRDAIEAAARTDEHQDVAWLLANRA